MIQKNGQEKFSDHRIIDWRTVFSIDPDDGNFCYIVFHFSAKIGLGAFLPYFHIWWCHAPKAGHGGLKNILTPDREDGLFLIG
jgi:hypothetical protein